jgi:carbon storage regulator
MLVLSRKCGEKIVIGGDIVVEVLGVQGDRIKLGITAPYSVPIVREELLRNFERPAVPVLALANCNESPYFPECW